MTPREETGMSGGDGLKVGIIGTGPMGERHRAGYLRLDSVRVVGAACRTEASRRRIEREWAVPCRIGLAALADEFPLDGVSLCTPTETHADLLAEALGRGLHVLVEKPLAHDPAACDRLIELARAHPDGVVLVAHTELYHPAVQRMLDLVREGALGRVVRVELLKAGRELSPEQTTQLAGMAEEARLARLWDILIHQVCLLQGVPLGELAGLTVEQLSAEPGAEVVRADLTYGTGPDTVRAHLGLDHSVRLPFLKMLIFEGETGTLAWRIGGGEETLTLERDGRKTAVDWPRGSSFDAVEERFIAAISARAAGKPLPRFDGPAEGAAACRTAWRIIAAAGETRAAAAGWLVGLGSSSFTELEARLPDLPLWLNHLPSDTPWPTEAADFADERVGRFARILTTIRANTALKRYHLRWALEEARRDRPFDADRVRALFYAGAFTRIHLLRFDNRCNQACLFCNVQDEVHDRLSTTTDEARDTLDRCVCDAVGKVTFTGGEPTIRRDLLPLIRYARERGLDDLDLQTNGMVAADPAYAFRLRDAGLHTALVSFHSHIPKLSEYLTHARGSWRKTVQGIRNLLDAGIGVRLSHVITTANMGFISDYLRFVARHFPEIRDLDMMLDQHRGAGIRHAFLLPRLSDIAQHLARALATADQLGLRLNSAMTIPPCRFGDRPEQTLEYQRLKGLEANEAEEDRFTAILRREKVKGPQCSRCLLDRYCLGVWHSYAERFGTDELTPLEKP